MRLNFGLLAVTSCRGTAVNRRSALDVIDKIEFTRDLGLGQTRQEPGLIQRRDKLCIGGSRMQPFQYGEHR